MIPIVFVIVNVVVIMNVIVRVTVVVIVVVMRVTVCLCGFRNLNLVADTPDRSTRSVVTRFHVRRQTAKRAPQVRQRQPDVEQRAEHHVPAAPEKQSKYSGLRHVRAFPSREN